MDQHRNLSYSIVAALLICGAIAGAYLIYESDRVGKDAEALGYQRAIMQCETLPDIQTKDRYTVFGDMPDTITSSAIKQLMSSDFNKLTYENKSFLAARSGYDPVVWVFNSDDFYCAAVVNDGQLLQELQIANDATTKKLFTAANALASSK